MREGLFMLGWPSHAKRCNLCGSVTLESRDEHGGLCSSGEDSMKMIIATAALAAGIAWPAFAQEQPAWRADIVQHRTDAFAQSVRDLPQYRSEPGWQAYAQYNAGRAQNAYARADIRGRRGYVGNPARQTVVQARRAGARDAYAQADIGGQQAWAGNPTRRTIARARRAGAQDAFAQGDIRTRNLNIRNPALRAYAVQFRQDAADNPLNAYAQSSLLDYRLHLGYAPWHVYNTRGEYVGTDPDSFIRGEMSRDGDDD
jgi:hypothetical protein